MVSAPPPDAAAWIVRPAQLFFIDLLLAGDNALVIGLFCRNLPRAMIGRVVAYGTATAVALRLILSFFAFGLLGMPGIDMIAAVLLVIIAANLVKPRPRPAAVWVPAAGGMLAAGIMVGVLDLLMSLDNVLALVAVAQGSWVLLAIGIAISVPLLISGTGLAIWLLNRLPWLVDCGGAVLGWVAGQLFIDDPAIKAAVATQAPALGFALPAALAFFIFQMGWGADRGAHEFEPPAAVMPPARALETLETVGPEPVALALEPPPELAAPIAVAAPEAVSDPADDADDAPQGRELRWFLMLFLIAGAVILVTWIVNRDLDF